MIQFAALIIPMILAQRTPAVDILLMFVIQADLITSSVAYAFMQISNHIIISLEILYFISIMMLILFHNLKVADYFLIKE